MSNEAESPSVKRGGIRKSRNATSIVYHDWRAVASSSPKAFVTIFCSSAYAFAVTTTIAPAASEVPNTTNVTFGDVRVTDHRAAGHVETIQFSRPAEAVIAIIPTTTAAFITTAIRSP